MNIVIQTAMKQPTGVVLHIVDGVETIAIRQREQMSKFYEEPIRQKAEEMGFTDFKMPEWVDVLMPPTSTYIDRGNAKDAILDVIDILHGHSYSGANAALKVWVTVDGDMVLPLKDFNKGGNFKLAKNKNKLISELRRLVPFSQRGTRSWMY